MGQDRIFLHIHIHKCIHIVLHTFIQLKSNSLHAPSCRISKMLIISPSKRDHTKMHVIVYLVLTWIRYLLPEWCTDVFFCLVIVVHESLVCPEQLNCLLFFRKILQLTQILWFSSIFVYLNPFQHWLYDFEIHLFTPRTTEGLICSYYRRFKHSPMPQKEKPCIKSHEFEFENMNLKIRVNLT